MNEQLIEQAGRFLMIGYEGRDFPEIEDLLLKVRPAGLVLFSRNIPQGEPEKLKEVLFLSQALAQKELGRPILIAVDQEGGTVKRLGPPFIQRPNQREVAQLETPAKTKERAFEYAKEMAAVGFNFNLAPVLDLATKTTSEFMKARSFGADPQVAADFGRAILKGHQKAGLLSCGKHFPGLGDAVVDPHHDLATVDYPKSRFESLELRPFKSLIKAGLEAVMTSHINLPAFDEEFPGTFSAKVIDYLRAKMNFKGLALTDDLEMGAVVKNYPFGAAASLAIKAGHDLALVCRQPEYIFQAQEALIKAVKSEEISEAQRRGANERLAAALTRLNT